MYVETLLNSILQRRTVLDKPFDSKVDSFSNMLDSVEIGELISNFNCEVGIKKSGVLSIPYTKSSMKNKKVCYTISQMSHNYHYAKRELEIEDLGISRFFIYPMLEILAIFLRLAKVDNSIMLNNWGISTNLYPKKIDESNLRKIIDECLEENKRESVIFRSVNSTTTPELELFLENAGFKRIFSRNIIIFPYLNLKDYKRSSRRQISRDSELEKDYDLTWKNVEQLNFEEAEQVKNLYDQLYLDKYSHYNPQFTTEFFIQTSKLGIFSYNLLYSNEKMVGVIGTFSIEGLSTNPILGYDFHQDFSEKLYRILTAKIATLSSENNLRRHASSGAMEFKKLRGGISVPEYTMVYTKNLNLFRRINWAIFRFISMRIAKPVIMRMENS